MTRNITDHSEQHAGISETVKTATEGLCQLRRNVTRNFTSNTLGFLETAKTATKGVWQHSQTYKLCGSPQHVGISKTVIIRTHDLQCFVVLLFHFPVTFYRTRGRPVRAVALSVILIGWQIWVGQWRCSYSPVLHQAPQSSEWTTFPWQPDPDNTARHTQLFTQHWHQ